MRLQKKSSSIFLLFFFLIVLFISVYVTRDKDIPLMSTDIVEEGNWFDEVYVDQSRYEPGKTVVIHVTLSNRTDLDREGKIVFTIKHLGQEMARLESEAFKIKKGDQQKLSVHWTAPKEDYQGYLVEAWLISDKEIKDKINSAVDVSSDWSRFPRYGYITNFGELTNEEISAKIERLNRYHINGLQFYDWQYKHHQPLAGTVEQPAEKWKDIANRDVYFDTVKEYIDQVHHKNMMAMNYNLLFGSYLMSEKDGIKAEWGLYKDAKHKLQDGHSLPNIWATGKIILENPANPEWQNYIIEKEQEAFQVFPFDGWHVDQLGDRGRLYDYQGNIIDLDKTYEPFLKKVKEKLNVRLVMNAVNDYGQINIAQSPVDFLYTEVWSPINTYGQLKSVIDRNTRLTKGEKNIVLTAYMNYNKANRPGEFNKASVLLTDAVIFASGGAHLELGDTGMLGKEYFPNDNLKMSPDLEFELRNYYHFLVAYQNLLRDHVESIDRHVDIDQIKASNYPAKETIWYFSKAKEGEEILHLINLSNQYSLLWRDDSGQYEEPEQLKNIKVKYYTERDVEKVFLASPDYLQGSAQPLSYTAAKDENGHFIEFTLPALKYWDMVYFTKRTTKE